MLTTRESKYVIDWTVTVRNLYFIEKINNTFNCITNFEDLFKMRLMTTEGKTIKYIIIIHI